MQTQIKIAARLPSKRPLPPNAQKEDAQRRKLYAGSLILEPCAVKVKENKAMSNLLFGFMWVFPVLLVAGIAIAITDPEDEEPQENGEF